MSIHRRDCHSYLALAERERARHRGGLGRDLGHVLSGGHQRARARPFRLLRDRGVRAAAPNVGVNTQSRQSLAHMVFTVEVRGGESLTRALDALAEVQGVSSAVRR